MKPFKVLILIGIAIMAVVLLVVMQGEIYTESDILDVEVISENKFRIGDEIFPSDELRRDLKSRADNGLINICLMGGDELYHSTILRIVRKSHESNIDCYLKVYEKPYHVVFGSPDEQPRYIIKSLPESFVEVEIDSSGISIVNGIKKDIGYEDAISSMLSGDVDKYVKIICEMNTRHGQLLEVLEICAEFNAKNVFILSKNTPLRASPPSELSPDSSSIVLQAEEEALVDEKTETANTTISKQINAKDLWFLNLHIQIETRDAGISGLIEYINGSISAQSPSKQEEEFLISNLDRRKVPLFTYKSESISVSELLRLIEASLGLKSHVENGKLVLSRSDNTSNLIKLSDEEMQDKEIAEKQLLTLIFSIKKAHSVQLKGTLPYFVVKSSNQVKEKHKERIVHNEEAISKMHQFIKDADILYSKHDTSWVKAGDSISSDQLITLSINNVPCCDITAGDLIILTTDNAFLAKDEEFLSSFVKFINGL